MRKKTLLAPTDKVIIRRLDPEEITPGGIVLPDMARETPIRGRVLAVGPGPRLADGTRAPMDVRVGDEVLITPNNYATFEVKIDGSPACVVEETDVLAIIERDGPDVQPWERKPGKSACQGLDEAP